jgi:hypothetical protein
MTTKDIRTSHVHVACDVCGRTLLRGERAETYLAGGSRRQVCELCTARALNEGWVREGLALERATGGSVGDRRRSLLGRLRRAGGEVSGSAPEEAASSGNGWTDELADAPQPRSSAPAPAMPEPRERRQVHAVPSGVEQRTAAALARFNQSEHPRTIAGVARSLGSPVVVARPLAEQGELVTIVVSWELCWYRFEVDVSDDAAAVRAAGQGYELAELDQEDCAVANAVADEYGTLAPA